MSKDERFMLQVVLQKLRSGDRRAIADGELMLARLAGHSTVICSCPDSPEPSRTCHAHSYITESVMLSERKPDIWANKPWVVSWLDRRPLDRRPTRGIAL